MAERSSILFVCVENAGRSQMAETFAGKHGLNASSADTVLSRSINQIVVEAMKEKGIAISGEVPKMLTNDIIQRATLVVRMGCSVAEVCQKPMLAQMQKKLEDWNLPDPNGKELAEVRIIRDEIERKVEKLSKEF